MSPERRKYVEAVSGSALAHLEPLLHDVPPESRHQLLLLLTNAIGGAMEAEIAATRAGCRSGDAIGRIRGALGAIRKLCDAKDIPAWSAGGG